MKKDTKVVKELIEAFSTPIVYHPGGWDESLPRWLKEQVLIERMGMALDGGWNEATDAEIVCYLNTASMAQPISSDWIQIYLYEAALLMPQIRQAIPDIKQELTDWLKSELQDLKRRIRDSQKRKRKKKEVTMAVKVVLDVRDGEVIIGVGRSGCDPCLTTVKGELEDVLKDVPEVVKQAEAKWQASPRNPAYKPPPAPRKPTAAPPAPDDPTTPTSELPLLAGAAETAKPEAAVEPAAAVAEEVAVPPEEAAPVAEPKAEVEVKEPTQAAPAPSAKPGEWEYSLQDGRGPFESIQAAMDELGLDKNARPQHNRWDRLSTHLKDSIRRRVAKQ